jgi:hypothetical protein
MVEKIKKNHNIIKIWREINMIKITKSKIQNLMKLSEKKIIYVDVKFNKKYKILFDSLAKLLWRMHLKSQLTMQKFLLLYL